MCRFYIIVILRGIISGMVKKSYELQVMSWNHKSTSWKLKSTSRNSKVRLQNRELRVQTHGLQVQIHELQVQIYGVQIHELWVQSYQLWFQIYELWVQIHELRVSLNLRVTSSKFTNYEFKSTSYEFKYANHWINENSSKLPQKFLIWPIVWQFVRQLTRSVFGGNLLFYVSTTAWLRLQQEAEGVSTNFERRNLSSSRKCHPPSDNFGEIYFFLCF